MLGVDINHSASIHCGIQPWGGEVVGRLAPRFARFFFRSTALSLSMAQKSLFADKHRFVKIHKRYIFLFLFGMPPDLSSAGYLHFPPSLFKRVLLFCHLRMPSPIVPMKTFGEKGKEK